MNISIPDNLDIQVEEVLNHLKNKFPNYEYAINPNSNSVTINTPKGSIMVKLVKKHKKWITITGIGGSCLMLILSIIFFFIPEEIFMAIFQQRIYRIQKDILRELKAFVNDQLKNNQL